MKLIKKDLEKSLLITKLKKQIEFIKRDLKEIHNNQIKLEIQKKVLQFKLRGLWVQNAFRL